MADPSPRPSGGISFTFADHDFLDRIERQYGSLIEAQEEQFSRDKEALSEATMEQTKLLKRRNDMPEDMVRMVHHLLWENYDLRLEKLAIRLQQDKDSVNERKKSEERHYLRNLFNPGANPPGAAAATSVSQAAPPLPANPVQQPTKTLAEERIYQPVPDPTASAPKPKPTSAAAIVPNLAPAPTPDPSPAPVATAEAHRGRQSGTGFTAVNQAAQHSQAAEQSGAAASRAAAPLNTPTSAKAAPHGSEKPKVRVVFNNSSSNRTALPIAPLKRKSAPTPDASPSTQAAHKRPRPDPSISSTVVAAANDEVQVQTQRESEAQNTPGVARKDAQASNGSDTIVSAANDDIPPQDRRTVTFDEVYQGGNAAVKHTMVAADGKWYILKCEEHGVSFRPDALTAAAKHLDSKVHGYMGRLRDLALRTLGYRVLDCDEKLADHHNAIVKAAFDNGYKPPTSDYVKQRKQASRLSIANASASKDELLAYPNKDNDTGSVFVAANTDGGDAGAGIPTPGQPWPPKAPKTNTNRHGLPSGGRRKSRASKLAVAITEPVAGDLYYAAPKPKIGDSTKKYIVMVLAWKELDICGLPGQTLGQLPLITDAQRKSCYTYDRDGISGWAAGYESNGKSFKRRWFPVLWFEADANKQGWARAEELSPFPMEKVKPRGPSHPETRALLQYALGHGGVDQAAVPQGLNGHGTESSSRNGKDAGRGREPPVLEGDTISVRSTDSDILLSAGSQRGRFRRVINEDEEDSDEDYDVTMNAPSDQDDDEVAVASSQQAAPRRRNTQDGQTSSKAAAAAAAAAAVEQALVTPPRRGAAAGTRSSAKKQTGTDIEMADASPTSPTTRRSRRASWNKDGKPLTDAVSATRRLAALDENTPAVSAAAEEPEIPSVQLGTPSDKQNQSHQGEGDDGSDICISSDSKEDEANGDEQQPLSERELSPQGGGGAKATTNGMVVVGGTVSGPEKAQDKAISETVRPGRGEQTPSEEQVPSQDKGESATHNASEPRPADDKDRRGSSGSAPSSMLTEQARLALAGLLGPAERRSTPAADTNGGAQGRHRVSSHDTSRNSVDRGSTPRIVADAGDRWRAVRNSNSPIVAAADALSQAGSVRRSTEKTSAPVSASASTSTSPAVAQGPWPAPVSTQGLSFANGKRDVSLSLSGTQSPSGWSPIVRAGIDKSYTFEVSYYKLGDKAWEYPTQGILFTVNDQGVARSDEAEAAGLCLDPRKVDKFQYNRNVAGDKFEVVMHTQDKGEQRLLFTTGGGRQKQQGLRFLRWLQEMNPSAVSIDGVTLPS